MKHVGLLTFILPVNLKKREVVEKQEGDKNVKIKFIDNA